MSKRARSLRFVSADAMPTGMRALYEAQRPPPPRPGTPVPEMLEGDRVARVPDKQPSGIRRRCKYGAVPTDVDGIRFASKREARYYATLKLRVVAGEVRYFLRQVPFHLPGRTRYVVDFMEVLSTGEVKWIDVKGMETSMFKLKKKQVEDLYPVTIEVVR